MPRLKSDNLTFVEIGPRELVEALVKGPARIGLSGGGIHGHEFVLVLGGVGRLVSERGRSPS